MCTLRNGRNHIAFLKSRIAMFHELVRQDEELGIPDLFSKFIPQYEGFLKSAIEHQDEQFIRLLNDDRRNRNFLLTNKNQKPCYS